MLPFEKVTNDNIRQYAAFSPEEEAHSNTVENHPTTIESDLAEIEKELARKGLNATQKQYLMERKTELTKKLKGGEGLSALPFEPLVSAPESSGQLPFESAEPVPAKPKSDSSILDSAIGVGETALGMATGGIGSILGGIAGAVGATGGIDRGVDTLKSVSEALTYQPRSKKGQEYTGNVQEFMGKAIEGAAPFGEAAVGAIPFIQDQITEDQRKAIGKGIVEVGANFLPFELVGRMVPKKAKAAPYERVEPTMGEKVPEAPKGQMDMFGEEMGPPAPAVDPKIPPRKNFVPPKLAAAIEDAYKAPNELALKNAKKEMKAFDEQVAEPRPQEQMGLPFEDIQQAPSVKPTEAGAGPLAPEAELKGQQLDMVINPLDQIIAQAKADAELPAPKAPEAPKPVEDGGLPNMEMKQAELGLDEPNQAQFRFDQAAREVYPEGIPSVEDFKTKKDLPLVMSPQEVVAKFGIDESNIQSPKWYKPEALSPSWLKRDMWNDNPILRSVYDNMNYVRDKVNSWEKKLLDPYKPEGSKVSINPKDAIDNLNKNERLQYANAVDRYEGIPTKEALDEGRLFYNKREWMERGVPEKVADALVESSRMYAEAFRALNEDLVKKGIKPLEPIFNYMPHRHAGDFYVRLYDTATGQSEIFPFRNRVDARKFAESVPKQDGISVDYFRKAQGDDGFSQLLEMLRSHSESHNGSKSSAFTSILRNIEEKMDAEFFGGVKHRSEAGHYIGEGGFPENPNWRLRSKLQPDIDFVANSPVKYVQDAARFLKESEINQLKAEYQNAARDGNFAHTQAWSNITDLINRQADQHVKGMYETNSPKFIEDVIDTVSEIGDKTSLPGHAPVPWLSREALSTRIKNLNKVVTPLLISPITNPGLISAQFGQFITSPISLAAQVARVYAKNEKPSGVVAQLKATGKSPIVIGEAIARGMWDALAPQTVKHAGAAKALKWAKDNGHLDTMLNHEHLDPINKAVKTATMYQVTVLGEQIPRSISYLGMYHAYKRLGFSEMAARRAAVDAANTIMGDYTKEGKAPWMRNLGPVAGPMIAPFSTFAWNTKAQMASLMTGVGTHGSKNFTNSVVIPLATLGTATYALTGWGGAPGVADYDSFARFLNDTFKTDMPTSAELHMKLGKSAFGDQANNAYYGVASEKTGRDVAQSLRMQNLVDMGAAGVSYAGSAAKELYMEGKNALSKTGAVEPPTDDELYKARKGVTPPGWKWALDEAYARERPDGDRTLKSGIVRKEDETPLKRSFIPFNDLDEKKQIDVNGAVNYIKARQTAQSKHQMQLIKDKADKGQDFSKNLEKLVELNPDVAITTNDVVKALVEDQIKRQLTQGEFEALKAAKSKSLNKKQDAATRADFMQKILDR